MGKRLILTDLQPGTLIRCHDLQVHSSMGGIWKGHKLYNAVAVVLQVYRSEQLEDLPETHPAWEFLHWSSSVMEILHGDTVYYVKRTEIGVRHGDKIEVLE